MKIPRTLFVPIYVAVVAAFAYVVSLIAGWLGAYNPTAWGVFTLIGIFLAVILYVWGRQVWWFVSGTGDYDGRNGWVKRLWNKIFKK